MAQGFVPALRSEVALLLGKGFDGSAGRYRQQWEVHRFSLDRRYRSMKAFVA
ncbi:hypothetical protein U0C82_18935 [Fulvimarina sp. 2208YS6-2-32]|uniref:Uncharacterized protein n=1 Tax=Fulvimarina uroteuthidis TaxID=3098149 RepID=A0ABU5I7R8_9HYPH|nr:hypothetical protein [Fulvimarina sp. 2208YS6-2-32]MDY8111190.1 hypothetical protein [Fulvimarina sp. 2208YS6-2-32]